MKPPSDPEITAFPKNLHKLVCLAAGNLMPTAVQRNSFIVNEVSREFQIVADAKIVATVLNSLLDTIVNLSKHSCIRIKAKEYQDIVFVTVKDNSCFGNYENNSAFEAVQLLAKEINGSISIAEKEEKFTTILLSFPNFPIAA